MNYEHKYLFYLLDPDTGEYYYVDSNGNVDTQITGIPLNDAKFGYASPLSPEGWKNVEVKWGRSKLYWGLTRNAALPFTYHKDAAKIIRSLFLAAGTSAKCKLIINKKDFANDTSAVQYIHYYTGDLDFQKIQMVGEAVEIPVKESGLRDLFTQNENVPYELPLDPADTLDCAMTGITLQGKMKYVGTNIVNGSFPVNTIGPLALAFSFNEGNYIIGQDQQVLPSAPYLSSTPQTNNWFFRATRAQDATFEMVYKINFFPGSLMTTVNGGNPTYDIQVLLNFYTDEDATTEFTSVILHTDTVNSNTGADIDINATYTETLAEGNVARLFVIVFHNQGTGSLTLLDSTVGAYPDPYVNIYSEFVLPTTHVLAKREYQVFDEIVEAMTGGEYVADSDYFLSLTDFVDSRPYWTVYSSGDAIRGITSANSLDGEDAKMKVTPAEVFKNVMTDYGGAIYIEDDKVKFGSKATVLNKTNEIADLGDFNTKLTVVPAEDLLCNQIEVGNRENEYDELNGKDEFMNTLIFKAPTTTPEKLDLIRPFRYDMYGIENLRAKYFEKDSTDNTGDNQTFVWEIDTSITVDGGVVPRRAQNAGGGNFAAGLLFPATAYNISKSPRRVLERNGDYIRSILYFQSASFLSFQTTQKNSKLYSDLGYSGVVTFVQETAGPSTIEDMLPEADLLFIPLYLRFKIPVSAEVLTALNANAKGYLKATINGVEIKGFPMNLSRMETYGGATEVELLCHPDMTMEDIEAALTGNPA